MELAEQATKEQDSDNFLEIIAEMDALLDADKRQRVKDKKTESPSSE